jgi:hypothetical protein
MNMSTESDEKPVEIITETSEPALVELEVVKKIDQAEPKEIISGAPAPEPTSEAVVKSDEAPPASVAETKAEEKESPPKSKMSRRAAKRPSGKQPTLKQVTARFAGCGRCSYFWVGYRVIHGVAELETAVAYSQSGWLDLEWDVRMPELIYKTYGVRMDISHFHYEGVCKECRRHFVYKTAVNEDGVDDFRIEISPQTS